MAERTTSAKLTLAISDVPGDDLSVIASGPTVADASTCADAWAIIDRYPFSLPAAARAGLESGTFEAPKPGDARLAGQQARIIATPQFSLEAAAALARSAGLAAHILSDEIEGESRDIGRMHAALARAVARRGAPFATPCVILSGGETTMTVRKTHSQVLGRGGRAGEFYWAAPWPCRPSPGCGRWRQTPTALTALKTTPVPWSAPTCWPGVLRSACRLPMHLIAITPMATLQQ